MDSEITRDVAMTGYYMNRIFEDWGQASREQFDRMVARDTSLMLVLTVVECLVLGVLFGVLVVRVFPGIKSRVI